MTPIRTILCPVDLSPLSGAEVALAADLARALGASLVLQHNLPSTGPGLAKTWEWKENHRGAGAVAPAEAGMKALLEGVPAGVAARSVITTGPLAIGIERLTEELPADLVVLGCHGTTTEDHSSLTEVLLHHCDCPVLTLREGCAATPPTRLGSDAERPLRFLVPTDLSAGGEAAARYALALAAAFPAAQGVRVDLLHVVEKHASRFLSRFGRPLETLTADQARARLEELVPAGMKERVAVRVEQGRPEEAILRVAGELSPDLIVMGEHTRELFARLFTHDVAQGVLHGARCPVWFVPPPRLAA